LILGATARLRGTIFAIVVAILVFIIVFIVIIIFVSITIAIALVVLATKVDPLRECIARIRNQ
jgi:hypothetical protein